MPDQAPAIHLDATHSHLFRGARLTGTDREIHQLAAGTVLLTFSDGVEVEAELLDGSRSDDEHALDVPAYRTAAGNAVAAAVWPVAEFSLDDGQLRMTVGQRLI